MVQFDELWFVCIAGYCQKFSFKHNPNLLSSWRKTIASRLPNRRAIIEDAGRPLAYKLYRQQSIKTPQVTTVVTTAKTPAVTAVGDPVMAALRRQRMAIAADIHSFASSGHCTEWALEEGISLCIPLAVDPDNAKRDSTVHETFGFVIVGGCISLMKTGSGIYAVKCTCMAVAISTGLDKRWPGPKNSAHDERQLWHPQVGNVSTKYCIHGYIFINWCNKTVEMSKANKKLFVNIVYSVDRVYVQYKVVSLKHTFYL